MHKPVTEMEVDITLGDRLVLKAMHATRSHHNTQYGCEGGDTRRGSPRAIKLEAFTVLFLEQDLPPSQVLLASGSQINVLEGLDMLVFCQQIPKHVY